MAQFTNTKRIDTINRITEGFKSRLDNPYNITLNLKPYVVDYWNQSLENTTNDEASNLIYKTSGVDSPVRFNKIENAVMFGLPQTQLDLEIGDYGLEGNGTEGETTILPNTWTPYPGDFFSLKHLDSIRVYMVSSVTPDTMPNGANFYKIQFDYASKEIQELDTRVVETFRFIMDNVGTNFRPVIKSTIYNDIEDIEAKASTLKKYYRELFYHSKVQTYVYHHNGYFFYDPYMIEFLSRNDIMNDDTDFAYVGHAIPLDKTFSIDYDKTYLRSLELRDKDRSMYTSAVGKYIDNKLTLFYYRSESFFRIEYNSNLYADEIPVVNLELLERIKKNTLYQVGEIDEYKNIIIRYFNFSAPTSTEIQAIQNIDFGDNIDLFYNIPSIIYILERYIKELITRSTQQAQLQPSNI